MLRHSPVLLLVAAFLLTGCNKSSSRDTAGAASAPTPDSSGLAFRDATSGSGVSFRHYSGARGRKWLPETMGPGVALIDFDRDGRLDIFLVDGREFDGTQQGSCKLFRGMGGARFEDVTEKSGAGIRLCGMGATAADYDGDGDVDILVTAWGSAALLRNDSGRFTDVGRSAGLAAIVDSSAAGAIPWSTAAAFLDGDGDGDLDLFVGQYVAWSPERDIFTTIDGVAKAFTTPDRYRGLGCKLGARRM